MHEVSVGPESAAITDEVLTVILILADNGPPQPLTVHVNVLIPLINPEILNNVSPVFVNAPVPFENVQLPIPEETLGVDSRKVFVQIIRSGPRTGWMTGASMPMVFVELSAQAPFVSVSCNVPPFVPVLIVIELIVPFVLSSVPVLVQA